MLLAPVLLLAGFGLVACAMVVYELLTDRS